MDAPSFDPLFRAEIITIPPCHPVYRWNCLVTGCERPKAGRGDLCSAHLRQWRERRRRGGTARAEFVRTAAPAGAAVWIEERPCRICPGRPARGIALVLCDKHQFRWYRHLEFHGADADFDGWLAVQRPYPGYGGCRVLVCPETANSPLGLCARHERRYQSRDDPAGPCCRRSGSTVMSSAVLPSLSPSPTRRRGPSFSGACSPTRSRTHRPEPDLSSPRCPTWRVVGESNCATLVSRYAFTCGSASSAPELPKHAERT